MKLETYLSACIAATYDAASGQGNPNKKRRQAQAFRTRIIKMDAEKDKQIKELLEISTKEGLARLEKQDD